MKIELTTQEMTSLMSGAAKTAKAERDAAIRERDAERSRNATLKDAADRAIEQEKNLHREYRETQARFTYLQEVVMKATGCKAENTALAVQELVASLEAAKRQLSAQRGIHEVMHVAHQEIVDGLQHINASLAKGSRKR